MSTLLKMPGFQEVGGDESDAAIGSPDFPVPREVLEEVGKGLDRDLEAWTEALRQHMTGLAKFDPEQERDEQGRWTSTGTHSDLDAKGFKQTGQMGPSRIYHDAEGSRIQVFPGRGPVNEDKLFWHYTPKGLPTQTGSGRESLRLAVAAPRSAAVEAAAGVSTTAVSKANAEAVIGRTVKSMEVSPAFREQAHSIVGELSNHPQLVALLEKNPIPKIVFQDHLPGVGVIGAMAGGAFGIYNVNKNLDAGTGKISLATKHPGIEYGKQFDPGRISAFASIGKTLGDSQKLAFMHEVQHHAFFSEVARRPELGRSLQLAFDKSQDTGKAVSGYARTTKYEYGAETTLAYLYLGDRLKVVDPVGHEFAKSFFGGRK